jgi:hypothetical protein
VTLDNLETPEPTGLHWRFGSPSGPWLDSRELERRLAQSSHGFRCFDEHLRSFIAHSIPEEAPRYEDLINVCSDIQLTIFSSFLLKFVPTGSVIQMPHNPVPISRGLEGGTRYFAL